MSVGAPWLLPWAVAIPLLTLWMLRVAARRRESRDLRYSNLGFLRDAIGKRDLPTALLRGGLLLGVALVPLAFAQLRVRLPVPIRDGAVVLCIDTSGSMASTDIVPTRALAARSAARRFIAEISSGERVGIVAFSGNATVIQPLTADRAAALAAVSNIPPPNGATAIGDALRLAGSLMPTKGPRTVVLVTDGVNNTGSDPLAAAQSLGEQGIHVDTVGIGSNVGAIIPGTSELAGIDNAALRAYANAAGGRFVKVGSASQLRGALGALGRITSFVYQRVDVSRSVATIASILLGLSCFAAVGLGRVP